jgi:hypothetical protein
MPEPTCSKQVGGLCGQPAVEFLLVSSMMGEWHGKARCKDHPAADDLRVVRRVSPLLCALVAKVVPDA